MATLAVAAVLGVTGSAIETVVDWRLRRIELQDDTAKQLEMLRGAAEAAAYQLDPGLAKQVADGLMQLTTVAKVRILDDYGNRLAEAARTDRPADGALDRWLFGDVTVYRMILRHGTGDAGRLLGHLELELSAAELAHRFYERHVVTFWLGLTLALAICALVAAIFALLVTRPIVQLAEAVGRVDPGEPGRSSIPVPRGHQGDELEALAMAINNFLAALQNSLTQRDSAIAENMRLGAEVDISRRLQRMVLPTDRELAEVTGLDIATYMEPASEVGGDYYDILPMPGGGVCIGIGDVTGHGLESGVVMLMAQSAVRTLVTGGGGTSSMVFDVLNRTLVGNLRRMASDRNLTLALALYQPVPAHGSGGAGGQLRISGQHESVMIVRRDGELENIDTIDLGMPLGLIDDIGGFVADVDIALAPGDVVVMYTDGITEAADTAHRLYGFERFYAVVQDHRNLSAEHIKQAVLEDVTRHIGTQPIWDDLTLIVLKQR